MYIHGAASISPLGNLKHSKDNELPYLESLEPDYSEIIAPRAMRRMGKAVKMGVYCGLKALQEAGVENPNRIIVGTGLGCMSDTEKFLNNIVDDDERLLNPTPFIQSTHNTIAGQIALMIKCESYNFTYVHRGFSFESALLDAELFLLDNPSENILIGGIDAITAHVHDVGLKLGYAKGEVFDPSLVSSSNTAGSCLGEGSAFFSVSGEAADGATKVEGLKMVYKPSSDEIHQATAELVGGKNIEAIVLGTSGDQATDEHYSALAELYPNAAKVDFKTGVGDYHSATAVGMWVGHELIQNGAVHPDIQIDNAKSSEGQVSQSAVEGSWPQTVLIYNHFRGNNHGLILLSRA
jgi:3-oxoacyl-[acyl-carrier-protein] synthase II